MGKHRNDCKSCCLVRSKRWVANNPEKRRAAALKWAKANYPYIRGKKAEYRARDPLRMRKWAIENPEKMQACRDRWDAENKDRKAEHAAARRARIRFAMPAWVDRDEVLAVYEQAKQMTDQSGERWEVDHIVPLAGKTVCGLHVPCNLKVIRMSDNRKKGHHRWPDMP